MIYSRTMRNQNFRVNMQMDKDVFRFEITTRDGKKQIIRQIVSIMGDRQLDINKAVYGGSETHERHYIKKIF